MLGKFHRNGNKRMLFGIQTRFWHGKINRDISIFEIMKYSPLSGHPRSHKLGPKLVQKRGQIVRNGNKRMLFGIQTNFGMGKSIGIYPFLKL